MTARLKDSTEGHETRRPRIMAGCRRLGQIGAALKRFADLNAGKRTSQRELLLIGEEQTPLAMR